MIGLIEVDVFMDQFQGRAPAVRTLTQRNLEMIAELA